MEGGIEKKNTSLKMILDYKKIAIKKMRTIFDKTKKMNGDEIETKI
jgi:hypothetical protein